MSPTPLAASVSALSGVSPEQWEKLGTRRLFFGHQSVGANVIDGVREVLERYRGGPIRIIERTEPGFAEPGLYHGRIGQNGAFESKLEAFRRVVGNDTTPDVGMLKFCYVDVTVRTNPDAMFETYRREVAALQAACGDLTIVHVTVPLTTDAGTLRHVAALARGKTPQREVNRIRERYNGLVRETYGGREAIFDLALLESTAGDDRRAAVAYRGERIPVLAAEWTDDGGHLNRAGRQRVAEGFLATLASLP